MNLGELRRYVRELMFDRGPPYLASDAVVDDALNRAYGEAVIRLGGILLEDDDDFGVIDLVPGQGRYDLNPRIYRIEPSQVRVDGFPDPLRGVTVQFLNERVRGWNSRLESDFARPEYFVPRIARTVNPSVTFARVPDAVYRVRFTCYRQVVDWLVSELDEPLDLGSDIYRHEALGHYAAGQILLRPETDLQNPVKASDHLEQFNMVFGLPRSAKDQDLDKDFTPRQVMVRRFC